MGKLVLVQKLNRPIGGYWDGGTKDTFTWRIEGAAGKDKKGAFVKVGSWGANHWFHVSKGKTDKATFGNVKRKLQAMLAKSNRKEKIVENALSCTFELKEAA
jgi:hypothetical protein